MKKILLAAALIISTSLIGATYYAYFKYIPEKIENKIIASFKNFGFEKLELKNITRKSGKIVFSDIYLDKEKFSSIGELSVHFSLLEFIFNPAYAKKIIISDMNLSGEYSNDQFTFSGWNNDNKILQSVKNIPANIIVIKGATIDILSDNFGGIKLSYDGQARLSKSGDIKLKGQITSKQRKLAFQAKINGTIPANGDVFITAQCDQISLAQEDLSIKRGAATIELKHSIENMNTSISATGDFSSVNWYNMPLRDVQASLKSTKDSYTLSAKGKIFGKESIDWDAKITNNNNNIVINTEITPRKLNDLLSFLHTNKRLKKNANFPPFILDLEQPKLSIITKINDAGVISGDFKFLNLTPKFGVSGVFSSNKNTKNIRGKISPTKSSITSENKKARFNQISAGEFIIRNLKQSAELEWYLNTKVIDGTMDYGALDIEANGNYIYISNTPNKSKGHLNFKLPLKSSVKQNGRIITNLTDKDQPLFQAIILKIYDGTIKTQHPIFENNALTKSNKLTISDINLAKLFRDAKFKDARILGELGGVMPIVIDGDKIDISGSILQSQNNGIIRLSPRLIKGLFPDENKETQLIRKALKNYHYEFFEIRLDGDLSDRVMVSISASGYNPDINNADPVDISLHIETQASLLFEHLLK